MLKALDERHMCIFFPLKPGEDEKLSCGHHQLTLESNSSSWPDHLGTLVATSDLLMWEHKRTASQEVARLALRTSGNGGVSC